MLRTIILALVIGMVGGAILAAMGLHIAWGLIALFAFALLGLRQTSAPPLAAATIRAIQWQLALRVLTAKAMTANDSNNGASIRAQRSLDNDNVYDERLRLELKDAAGIIPDGWQQAAARIKRIGRIEGPAFMTLRMQTMVATLARCSNGVTDTGQDFLAEIARAWKFGPLTFIDILTEFHATPNTTTQNWAARSRR